MFDHEMAANVLDEALIVVGPMQRIENLLRHSAN
jgi:hypothetical protein